MRKTIISTERAPAAIGPYSQAVVANGMVFVSGQIPIQATTGKVITEDIQEATKTVLSNLGAILAAAGSSLDHLVKTTVFLRSMDDFPVINEIYGSFFSKEHPARACVEVSALPKGVPIEIEAVALLKDH
jgi:2-iminobutanoate/2-iminopropanoate deaminase